MVPLDDLLASLELQQAGEHHYRATSADAGHGVVFGGQLLAQSIVAATAEADDKHVVTLHTVFARPADPSRPLEVHVDGFHSGRSFASSTVTISQGDRPCVRSNVLLAADDEDFIQHADGPPDRAVPAKAPGEAGGEGAGGERLAWEVVVEDDVDVSDPDAVGPPDLDVWVRFPGAPDDPVLDQALLAFATDAFLIGTAMRPHRGVGQAQAHVSLSTGVVSHTLTFHRRSAVNDWLLMAHHSDHAGSGRSHGRAAVFNGAGELVASFVQDAVIRPIGSRRR